MISKVLTACALVLALALSGCGEGHTVPSGQEEQGGAAMETEFTVDPPSRQSWMTRCLTTMAACSFLWIQATGAS